MSNDEPLNEIYKLLENSLVQKKLIEIINEKKAAIDLTNNQLSQILSIDKSTFDRLIKKIEDGDIKSVDFFHILKICQFFGISVDEISQIYVASLKPEYISELETAKKANFFVRNFDLKALKEVGFIDSITDIKAIEKRFVSFFALETIYEYDEEVGHVLFSRTKKSIADKMREFWVRSAYYQFEKINNPNEFDKEKLLAIIPKIRPYTRYEEKGFLTVIRALYEIGITVIIQKYLAKTQVRGATFVVNDKPCIVITDFNKLYSTLWFALMHELYHVLYDLDALRTWKFHTSGDEGEVTKSIETDLFNEADADYFSRETLFPLEKLNYIRHLINSPAMVSEYAKEAMVHPSIIYSFYCFEEAARGNNYYAFYQKYFGKPDRALAVVRTNPWDKETIYQEIEKIKKILTAQ